MSGRHTTLVRCWLKLQSRNLVFFCRAASSRLWVVCCWDLSASFSAEIFVSSEWTSSRRPRTGRSSSSSSTGWSDADWLLLLVRPSRRRSTSSRKLLFLSSDFSSCHHHITPSLLIYSWLKQQAVREVATICPRPLQVDMIFVFIRQVAPVPPCWLFKTSATS